MNTFSQIANYPLSDIYISNWKTDNSLISCDTFSLRNDYFSNAKIFNSDWFLISESDIDRIYYNKMNPDDFRFLRYSYDNMPVIHDNAFLVLSNGSVVLNPPPVFIVPEPISIILLVFGILVFLAFARRVRSHLR